MASNQTDITQAPFLPMGRQGHQGYEAHYQVSETFEVTQFHCHDYFEFYIHVRGGEYMGVDNQLLNLSPEVMRVLSCGQIDLDQFFRSQASSGVCTYQLTDPDAKQFVAWIRRIRENQENESFENDAYHRFQNYTLMMNLMTLLCRTTRRTAPVEGEAFGSGIIQEILSYINNHYTQPIRIENLARSFGVSVSYLSHEFVRFTNRSVYDYVLYRRVMLARQQMLGSASLNDIAYQCGFNDYSNFLRSFSKIVGMSPSQYRKQLRQYRKKEIDASMQL